jgi:hypothetical protein
MTPSRLARGLRRSLSDARTSWEARHDRSYRRLSHAYRLPDGSERVYCYHIRKTGGTSLHYSFLALGHEDPHVVEQRLAASALRRTISGPYAFVAHQRRLLEEGSYFYGWSHLPAHRIAVPARTFTVTVLRDPVQRVVSLFWYLAEGDRPGAAFPIPESERALSAKGFASFLDQLPKRDLLRQVFMFSPTFDVAEAVDRIGRCSYAFVTEEYESGVAGLARRLDLPLSDRRENVTRAPAKLGDEDLARLRELLEPEYAMIRQLKGTVLGLSS